MGFALNIGSEKPAELIAYYRKLFGEPVVERGGFASWELAGSFLTVGPHDEVSGKNRSPGRLLWSILSTDIDAEVARFVDAGAIVVRPLYRDADAPQFRIATFADPDDNYFQVVAQDEGSSTP